jgi:hypothetical protein
MARKNMKKCSIPLTIKEMQIKTELRFYLTTVRMAIIKKQTTTNAGEDVGEKEALYTVLVGM